MTTKSAKALSALTIGLTIYFKEKPAEGWDSVFVDEDEKYCSNWYPRQNLKDLWSLLDDGTVFAKGHDCLVSECLYRTEAESCLGRAKKILEVEGIKNFMYTENAPLGVHIIIRLL